MNDILSGILNVLLIAVICIAAVFALAVVITVIHEKRRKASGKKRGEFDLGGQEKELLRAALELHQICTR